MHTLTRLRNRGIGGVLLAASCLVAAGPRSALAQDADRPSQQEELAARRREKAERLEPEAVSPVEARIRSLEEANFPSNVFVKGFNGFRPVVGGMPSGSGLVGGVGWAHGLESEWYEIDATATYSTRGFRQASARLELANRPGGFPISGFVTAAYQDYPGLRTFGIGNDSDVGDRVFFGQRNALVGGGVEASVSRFLDVEAHVRRVGIALEPSNRAPSVGIGSPVLQGESTFHVYGGQATLRLVDRYGFPPVGVELVVGVDRYDDRDRRRHSFTRYVGEVRGQVPLGYRNRRLALRARTSISESDDGHTVPPYLMETVGGARTLRGYEEYRFRDLRNLLLTAEYRWEVWTYMDMAVFYDAAKVFDAPRDLNLEDLHHAYGFGLRLRAPDDVAFDISLARSTEGFKVHFGGGRGF